MNTSSVDWKRRWARAVALMEARGVDALFLMKPANLAYLTGDGRPCALGLFTRSGQCVVSVPASDVPSVRRASVATDIRSFQSEEEMFHGFRDVLEEHRLSQSNAAATPGAPLLGIDEAMAAALERRRFGGRFLRPVFHGVGIEHEEAPIPGGHAVIHGEEKVDLVEAGMVLAIGNCGIYREAFGVRMEDTVWVTDRGPVVLTTHPRTIEVAARVGPG